MLIQGADEDYGDSASTFTRDNGTSDSSLISQEMIRASISSSHSSSSRGNTTTGL
jgi:hypothetical protein